ncbi:MAG: imidazolonepropionase [Chitinophagales bacterium]|nr:MAG: imidazolonepropionase [Chitinophagales bacterium]
MKVLIKSIARLVQTTSATAPVKGKDMSHLPLIENAWLLINDDRIEDLGTMDNCPENADIIIGAEGKMVFPCWCDSHTHLVYAGSREMEFVERIKGATYEQIAKKGGGILNSAKKLNQTSEEELLEQSLPRLKEIMMMGTGAVEIKSGYGLTVEGELKMLRVIKKLKSLSPLTIKATFLGAHAIPEEFKANRKKYLDLITKEMLPAIKEERLADFIDVFCDKGFFTPEETDTILQAGAAIGLRPKIHANELGLTGGVQAGVKNNALSVDHLEHVGEEEIHALLHSDTIPTLLPSTAFFLGLKYAPARKLIQSGLPVALASDYNPGSSPSGNMPFVLSLACLYMKMTPEEAIHAATINGACAMDVQNELGSIAKGKKANVFITKKIPSVAFLPYAFGSNLIDTVIINGKVQTGE